MVGRSQQIAVFDVCDTLFRTNTTVGFVRFLADRTGNAAASAVLRRWTSRRSPALYAGALAYRLLHRDIARARVIRTLRGYTREQLEAAAEDYFSTELASHMVEPVHERLRDHQRRGDRVILASSSLDVVISAVARGLGVEWVASELGYADGQCTGRLVRDLTGRKPAALAPLLGDTPNLHVYTDNRSDRALLQMADRCTIILPAGSDGCRWAGEECDYLAV